ncbi:MAG: chromosome segregation protein SMC [Castellaniella sp.]
MKRQAAAVSCLIPTHVDILFLPVHLTQIKLAGFKSFAEPTRIATPGRLVGVVGPNGCGKSNIIDAVRWVLGESRASELRGESMQDVIFNGSAGRKPAARASVELVFDNSSGRVTGAWGAYAEIAIRRVLARDGASQYVINGQTVRRRDVHDVFLGTGLGARGYAIIGQGMINRLIEARPEDLRNTLEEAAGVTRYKERRREAQQRLRETRDNLLRVADILHELEDQLVRLQSQSEQAQRHQALQAERREKEALAWLVQEDAARADQASLARALQERRIQLEAMTADLRAQQAGAETLRQAWHEAGETVHEAQGRLYQAGAEVGRLEAEQRRIGDMRRHIARQQADLQGQQRQWQADQAHRSAQGGQAARQVEDSRQVLMRGEARLGKAAQALPALEKTAAEAGHALEQARRRGADSEREHALAMQALQSVQRQHQALAARQERLEVEKAAVRLPAAEDLQALEQSLRQADTQEAQAAEHVKQCETVLPDLEQAHARAQARLREFEQTLLALRAEIAGLQAMQESARARGRLTGWLAAAGLADAPPLWTLLRVATGWETALEAVLQERLAAVGVDAPASLKRLPDLQPPARISVYALRDTVAATAATPADALEGAVPLLDHVSAADAQLQTLLSHWLHGVYVCATWEDALARRDALDRGQCIVLPDGHVIDAMSVRLHAPESDQSGLLARRTRLVSLEAEAAAAARACEQAGEQARQARIEVRRQAQALEAARSARASAREERHRRQLALGRLQQAQERAGELAARLQAELADAKAQRAQLESEDAGLAQRCEALAQERRADEAGLAGARHAAQQAQAGLAAAREQGRALEREVQAARHDCETARSRVAALEEAQLLAQAHAARIHEALDALALELGSLDDAGVDEALQQALLQRQECEMVLGRVRRDHETAAVRLREADEARLQVERALEPARQALSEAQLAEQAARLNAARLAAQLDEAGADRSALRTALAGAPAGQRSADGLRAQVRRLTRQLDAMGAVNLAAPDELARARERQGFLQSQHDDLDQAMQTLQDAIARIDAETRARLAASFDEANRHFAALFPQLFGGGQARLVLTGEEILDAGVQVMAQPPGKRNTTIHLLSGGEKALAAIALVFALFRLNPAPFCLLDEVDAPLDDANTERYCRLVERMSEQTQFLFISHNKIAMQMARQLIGVTMQEEGVSRIVAVDMASALQMAGTHDAET